METEAAGCMQKGVVLVWRKEMGPPEHSNVFVAKLRIWNVAPALEVARIGAVPVKKVCINGRIERG